jgi:hypothetical protein
MNKIKILAGCIVLLFLGVALTPASAQRMTVEELVLQEAIAVEKFMDEVESIAAESETFREFAQKFRDLCTKDNYDRFPVIKELITKIQQTLLKQADFSIAGIDLADLLGKLSGKLRPDFFVISFGAYHRLNPRKENSIERFKQGLSMWRYSDASRLLKGRTLVLERQPFGIHQKMVGPQLGFMKGFKGIFIDIQSKLTGNSYVIFLGSVHRIRAFDLTPLSK